MRDFITYDRSQEYQPLMEYLGLERVLRKTACYDDVLVQVRRRWLLSVWARLRATTVTN